MCANATLTMFQVRADRQVEPLTLGVLKVVASVAAKLELQWFVVGAMARDIVLTGVFGLDVGRATRDVDLAVSVASWDQFTELKQQLLNTGQFAETNGVAHRLSYRPTAGNRGYPLDLIPFGGVEGGARFIAWPPDLSEIMNVAGYEEALGAAIEVRVESGLVVRVASLPGLAVLKLLAWKDRGNESSKDAIDLVTLMRRYSDAGNEDRLYGSEIKVLETVAYRMELAGPRLLGRDVRAILTAATAERLQEVLDDGNDRLVSQMARAFPDADDRITEVENLLDQFRAGLRGD